ncbi:unnamed protein product [Linum trigynum]|uniref:Uncharacterized protein n=1 Tax=Linum trigynum TaxID=586398 RepID=A0AAV2F230_9ROSI
MEAKERHEKVKALLNVTVLEMVEPLSVSYSLTLSSGEVLRKVKATEMVRWDKDDDKLYVQRVEKKTGSSSRSKMSLIEFACRFSEVIAKGILWDKEDHHVKELSGIIKLAFLLDFDEATVEFLMKLNNLQIFVEDEEFLSSAFPPPN